MLRSCTCIMLGIGLGFASAAHAGAVKILEFTPVLNGVSENPEVDGVAILNYSGGTGLTAVRINVTGLEKNTLYNVQVRGSGGLTSAPIETNSAGILHFNHDLPNDTTMGGAMNVHAVVFKDANGDQALQPSELRAIGCASGSCTVPLVACASNLDCDDSNPCTNGACDLGYCAITDIACPDDGNVCTIDICNSGTGLCEYPPIFGCTP